MGKHFFFECKLIPKKIEILTLKNDLASYLVIFNNKALNVIFNNKALNVGQEVINLH